MRLNDEEFAAIVERAIASVPEGFHRYLEEIAVDIEDMPDDEVCADAGVRDPRELMGLYHGTPLTQRHVDAPYRYPERIVIYQRNIERVCRTPRQMI